MFSIPYLSNCWASCLTLVNYHVIQFIIHISTYKYSYILLFFIHHMLLLWRNCKKIEILWFHDFKSEPCPRPAQALPNPSSKRMKKFCHDNCSRRLFAVASITKSHTYLCYHPYIRFMSDNRKKTWLLFYTGKRFFCVRASFSFRFFYVHKNIIRVYIIHQTDAKAMLWTSSYI